MWRESFRQSRGSLMEDKGVVVVGAGTHSAMVVEMLELCGFLIVGLTDQSERKYGENVCGYTVLGGDNILHKLRADGVAHAVIGIGSTGAPSCALRKKIFEALILLGFSIPNLIHPSATVSKRACIGRGVQILAGAVIQAQAKILDNALINAEAVVEHDCVISNNVSIGSGAVLCGGVFVGEGSHIGANASVRQGVRIGKQSTLGMGAVAIRDIEDFSTAIGVPAKTIENRANKDA